jgi:hypothetical protein
MKSQENIEKILSAMISVLGKAAEKKGKEQALKDDQFAVGAIWMANFIFNNYRLDAKPEKTDALIKSRVLLDSDLLEGIEEAIKTAHIDAGYNTIFIPSASGERDESHVCIKCNYMKKERPDGLKMKSGHIWCRKTSREVLRKYWCKMGKWGYS